MNNGKITSQTDVISGEQVVYTYDALNRLATAQTMQTGGTQWGQSYNYDGFGNLTDQNVIKGSAPTMHVVYNASTNWQTGDTADANGNLGAGYIYDISNRLLQAAGTTMQYAYDANNKRIWRGGDEVAFWSPAGQKLATYQVVVSGSTMSFNLTATEVYFGARLIAKGVSENCQYTDCVKLTSVATDRLGSIGKFYPYGQERPSATANDTEKFTGYYRDAATGLDYADQRYEQPGVGRFMTADPAASSAKVTDPGSWNRYAYVGGDPINFLDPRGTTQCPAGSYNTCVDVSGSGDSVLPATYGLPPGEEHRISEAYWDMRTAAIIARNQDRLLKQNQDCHDLTASTARQLKADIAKQIDQLDNITGALSFLNDSIDYGTSFFEAAMSLGAKISISSAVISSATIGVAVAAVIAAIGQPITDKLIKPLLNDAAGSLIHELAQKYDERCDRVYHVPQPL
jgi:RHS repeat-associated protein